MESPVKKARLQEGPYVPAKIIAEIGCNHQGSKETAKELLTLAKEAGATVGKLQKRHPKELLTAEQYEAPHPAPHNSYASTYGAHREFLELSLEDHRELQAHCQSIGLEYASSVWDITSAKEIVSLKPKLIKVGSPSNLHWKMQEILRDSYEGEVHISTGMTSKEDVDKIIEFWESGKGDAKKRVVLYACTSAYPVKFNDVCLLEITRLKEYYGHRVKAIGFSGHHLGIAIDIAAYALGAEWIERHFTKDRTWKGTDHAASLEFPGLSKLVRDLNATYTSLTYKDVSKNEILEVEKEQRAKLKWGFYNREWWQSFPKCETRRASVLFESSEAEPWWWIVLAARTGAQDVYTFLSQMIWKILEHNIHFVHRESHPFLRPRNFTMPDTSMPSLGLLLSSPHVFDNEGMVIFKKYSKNGDFSKTK